MSGTGAAVLLAAGTHGGRVYGLAPNVNTIALFYDVRALLAAPHVDQDQRVTMVVYTDETLAATGKRSPLDRALLAARTRHRRHVRRLVLEHVVGFEAFRGALESVRGPLSPQALASQIFGLYTGFVYFTPLVGGLVGTILIGFLASSEVAAVDGLLYGGGVDQLGKQLVAAGATLVSSGES